MARCGAFTGSTGNVLALDDTALTCFSPDMLNDSFDGESNDDYSPFVHDCVAVDHDYCSPKLESLVENVVVYISGWVVRKVMQRLKCDRCRQSLVSSNPPSSFLSAFHLLTLKNNGGLVIPSEGLVTTCETAEKVIRQMTSCNKASNSISTAAMISKVLAIIGSRDIFELNEHVIETQYGIDNHHFVLVRGIATRYINLRQHHIAKLHTMQMHGSSLRHSITKTILFKGQQVSHFRCYNQLYSY
jgi:hypothetical protein